MNETVIKIPDLRLVLGDGVGAISFPNLKEIPLSKLVETYWALGNALRQNPNIILSQDRELILGVRQN